MSTIETQGRSSMADTNAPRSAPYSPITPADIEAKALFATRHNGPRDTDLAEMLRFVGASDMDAFIAQVVPSDIRFEGLLDLPIARTEYKLWHDLRQIAEKNKLFRSCIGMGYVGTITPPVILRNVLENPQWYTQYTPYQPETAQGRLEALLNFQKKRGKVEREKKREKKKGEEKKRRRKKKKRRTEQQTGKEKKKEKSQKGKKGGK